MNVLADDVMERGQRQQDVSNCSDIHTFKVSIGTLEALLRRFAYLFSSEAELQAQVAEVLTRGGVEFERERRRGVRDRVDFWLPGAGVCLEVKVDGALAAVTRQLYRYAEWDECRGLILLTNRAKHLAMPAEILGKPVSVVFVGGL
jgi:hypothetical protein